MSEELESHCKRIIKAIFDGKVVPFFGAGVNLCDRPEATRWEPGQSNYLPSGGELAEHLADAFDFPGSERQDLARVSQFATVMMGSGPLYYELRTLLNADYPPTTLHHFFAALPSTLREKGYPPKADPQPGRLVVVTTNYDDLLERAFFEAGEAFHLVGYVAEGEARGKFLHRTIEEWPPLSGSEGHLVEVPNEYPGLLLDQRPVVLKIHGLVDRVNAAGDSFVITEDHYIDYLTHTDVASLIPTPLPAILKNRHLLFLGYGLRDWNLRVILHRIWGEQRLSWKSWAIQFHADEMEMEFWRKRDVEILDVPLESYVLALGECVKKYPPVGGAV